MRSHLESLVDELKRLRLEGVENIYLEEATLAQLKERVASLAPSSSSAVPSQAGSPASGASKSNVPAYGEGGNRVRRVARNSTDPLQELVAKTERGQIKAPSPAAPKKKAAVQRQLNQKGEPIAELPSEAPVVELPEGDKQTRWEALREQVLNDPVCQEHLNPGAQVVFGVGSVEADVFFCGEAPGGDEEKQGEPFVGKAGELLTKIIKAMGVQRCDVYIGNIMNWRPEMPTAVGNRAPSEEEMAYCLPYLQAQIDVVKPKVIVALGMTAVSGLLGPDPQRRMGEIRGRWMDYRGTPLMVTYHPSYLLRNGTLRTKRLVWEDMMLVMDKVGLPISEKQRGFFLEK